MATKISFREVELSEQKSQDNGLLFPIVLSPNPSTDLSSAVVKLEDFKDAIKAQKSWLESLLVKSGAILFRGFPVTSASDFNDVVKAFDYPESLYIAGGGPRIHVVDRVYTANESPLDMEIPFHHEMAYSLNPPTKLFLFCEEEPESGGETPIVLSHVIYEKMKEKHPDFVAQLEEHGLTYARITNENDDLSLITGSGWKSAFMTDDKDIVQKKLAEFGAKLTWTGNTAKMSVGPLPAFRFDEESYKKTWFNSLSVTYRGPATEKFGNQNVSVELGNGDPVNDDAMIDLLKIMEEECVAIPWKKGDVLLLNNWTVLHSRRPLIKPPRRILVSMCK